VSDALLAIVLAAGLLCGSAAHRQHILDVRLTYSISQALEGNGHHATAWNHRLPQSVTIG